jgi:hypothetical protein
MRELLQRDRDPISKAMVTEISLVLRERILIFVKLTYVSSFCNSSKHHASDKDCLKISIHLEAGANETASTNSGIISTLHRIQILYQFPCLTQLYITLFIIEKSGSLTSHFGPKQASVPGFRRRRCHAGKVTSSPGHSLSCSIHTNLQEPRHPALPWRNTRPLRKANRQSRRLSSHPRSTPSMNYLHRSVWKASR